MPKTNYIYAELTDESKNRLISLIPFKFSKHFGDYVTLDWRVSSEDYKDVLGKTYKLTVDTLATDANAEAIRVDLSQTPLKSANKNPHITWSVAEAWDPFYSNYMLEVTGKNQKFAPTKIEVVVKDGLF